MKFDYPLLILNECRRLLGRKNVLIILCVFIFVSNVYRSEINTDTITQFLIVLSSLMLAFTAMLITSPSLVGDMDDGTFTLVSATPFCRWRYVILKIVSSTLVLMSVSLLAHLVILISTLSFGNDLSLVAGSFYISTIIMLMTNGFALLGSAISKSRFMSIFMMPLFLCIFICAGQIVKYVLGGNNPSLDMMLNMLGALIGIKSVWSVEVMGAVGVVLVMWALCNIAALLIYNKREG